MRGAKELLQVNLKLVRYPRRNDWIMSHRIRTTGRFSVHTAFPG
jgi:hypothetical protein